MGNTPFEIAGYLSEDASGIRLNLSANWFLPASAVADWRRQVIDKLIAARRVTYRRELAVWKPTSHAFPATSLTYLGNVMNSAARSFYREHGLSSIAPAYEAQAVPDAVLMFCKHCLRWEPYYLVGTDGKRFRLSFDCKNCQMKVIAHEEPL